MRQPPETITVDSQRIYCDGGDGPLGHPRVFLTMDATGKIDCPYCGKRFVMAAGAKAHGGH